MKNFLIFFLITWMCTIHISIAQKPFYMSQWPDVKGYWSFDNSSNLLFDSSSYSHPLVANGVAPTSANGYFNGDKAITLPSAATTNYISCVPNLTANGGGAGLNVYTIMYDVKISTTTPYYSLLQTAATATANDGDLFIKPGGSVGLSSPGYTSSTLTANQWARIVFVCDNNTTTGVWKVFIDGGLGISKAGQGVGGHYALSVGANPILLFADNDGENNSLTCSAIAIWDRALSDAEVRTLGGYSVIPVATYPIKPFLQTPTSTSMFVNWFSIQTAGTKVMYGLTASDLSLQASGSYEIISNKIWHSVKLTNLTPNTTYYYRCISGVDSSAIVPFHTAPVSGTAGGHIRFGLISDSQDNYQAKNIADNMKQTFIKLYGTDWYTKVACIMHNGDALGDGSVIAQYETQIFNNYYSLSANVPFMFTMGNHELSGTGGSKDSSNTLYYKFLKYEELSPNTYPNLLAERYYSYQLGNILYIVLNTNTQFENSTQSTWLENKLIAAQADTSIDFVFVSGHHPGKVEIWLIANDNYVQNTIYPILKKYSKVAAIHHGHEHAYERGTIKSTNADNVDFRTIMCGGGGGWLDHWADYTNCTDQAQVQKSFNYWEYIIYDIDMDNKSYTATTYSLGNMLKPLNNVVIDEYHGRINQQAPTLPTAISPIDSGNLNPILVASEISGADSIMTSQFQLTATPSNYTTTLVDITRDNENYFKDGGAPSYTPINKNTGINLYSYQIPTTLTEGKTYGWHVRYRDQNLKWSAWSNEVTFTPTLTDIKKSISGNNDIKIYPNPYSYETTIEFYQKETTLLVVEIYSETGAFVKTLMNDTCVKGVQKITLNNKFAPGIYYCKIKSADSYFYERVILQ